MTATIRSTPTSTTPRATQRPRLAHQKPRLASRVVQRCQGTRSITIIPTCSIRTVRFPSATWAAACSRNYYNDNAARHGGKVEAVYNCKQPSEGKWVQDLERGVQGRDQPAAVADRYLHRRLVLPNRPEVQNLADIVQMLVDIVSKNGNLLINIVQTPEGDLEPDMLKTLDEIGAWIAQNGEGIYGTRPWKVYGERPAGAPVIKSGNFNEDKIGTPRRTSALRPKVRRFMPSAWAPRNRTCASPPWAPTPNWPTSRWPRWNCLAVMPRRNGRRRSTRW